MVEKKGGVIHDTEWDLLEALWEAERGTARTVTDLLLEKRGWAVSTVKTMLDRMVTKGLVSARQVGPVWEYTPAVKRTVARRERVARAGRQGVRRRAAAGAPLHRLRDEAVEEGAGRAARASRCAGEGRRS